MYYFFTAASFSRTLYNKKYDFFLFIDTRGIDIAHQRGFYKSTFDLTV